MFYALSLGLWLHCRRESESVLPPLDRLCSLIDVKVLLQCHTLSGTNWGFIRNRCIKKSANPIGGGRHVNDCVGNVAESNKFHRQGVRECGRTWTSKWSLEEFLRYEISMSYSETANRPPHNDTSALPSRLPVIVYRCRGELSDKKTRRSQARDCQTLNWCHMCDSISPWHPDSRRPPTLSPFFCRWKGESMRTAWMRARDMGGPEQASGPDSGERGRKQFCWLFFLPIW